MQRNNLFKILTLVTLLFSATTAQAEPIEATVSSIDRETRTFTIDNIVSSEEGSDFTSPLDVLVGPGDAQLSYEGKKIRGELGKSDGKFMLEAIWPVDGEKEKMMRIINVQLQQDTAVRQRRQFLKEGDYGVNFSMFNDHGEVVQWNQFKGEWIIMNFIFTRCRMPKMCPAQTARMIDLQRLAKEKGIDNLQQLSVTFDPEYDTPGILYDYATSRGADLSTFSFLTGPKPVMLDVLKQYGVIAFDSVNIIDHTVTTLLFDKTGKIVLRRDGTEWSENEFVEHILDAEAKAALSPETENDTKKSGSDQPTVTDPDSSILPLLAIAIVLLGLIAAGVLVYSRKK